MFKKIILVKFILIFTILILNPNKSFSVDFTECYNQYADSTLVCENWSTLISKTYLITLAGSSAHVQINFRERKCTKNINGCTQTIYQIDMESFDFDFEENYNFTNLFFPGYPYDFGDCNEANLVQLYRLLLDTRTKEFFEDYTSGNKSEYLCNGLYPNCYVGDCKLYQAQYIISKCVQFCYWDKEITPSLHIVAFASRKCNSETECCKIESNYCWCYNENSLTWEIVKEEIINSSYQECDPLNKDDFCSEIPNASSTDCAIFCP